MDVHLRAGRPGRVAQALAVSLFLALGLSACGNEGSGKDLYSMACAGCHSADRVGIEDVGPDLGSTSFALEESNDWLAGRIREGFKGMPRFGRILTDNQTEIIVAYLRGADATTITTTSPTSDTVPAVATPTTTLQPTDISTSTTGAPTTATTAAFGADPDVLALGQLFFDVQAGGEGCASCHGFDARGTDDGPDITGESKSSIKKALSGEVREMEDIVLTADEIEAVYQYLLFLSQQR